MEKADKYDFGKTHPRHEAFEKKYGYSHFILEGKEVKAVPFTEYMTHLIEQRAPTHIIKKSYLPGLELSTVFTGISYDKPPLVFETMTFSAIEKLDQHQWRYETYDEALEKHDMIFDIISDGDTYLGSRFVLERRMYEFLFNFIILFTIGYWLIYSLLSL